MARKLADRPNTRIVPPAHLALVPAPQPREKKTPAIVWGADDIPSLVRWADVQCENPF